MQATDVYVDDLNCLAQGSTAQQQRVNDMFLQGINDIYPSIPEKLKEYVRTKKALQGYGDWALEKEIFGWILNSEAGTFQLPPLRLTYSKTFLAIPSTQRQIAVPKLCSLIEKLHFMHLAVPGAIGHFYYIH